HRRSPEARTRCSRHRDRVCRPLATSWSATMKSATTESLLAIRPEGGAGAILADPPWHFKTFSDKGQGKSPSQHYSTLTPDKIAALPVRDLAPRDCSLFLWVPTANLLQGLSVISGWGFVFVGRAFVWLKQTKSGDGLCTGLGKTTRK